MKASRFPRAYRLYDFDSKRMIYPEELEKLGVTLSPTGLPCFTKKDGLFLNSAIQWFSGQMDEKRKPLFEGDICRVGIANEFGSLSEDYAVMRWVPDTRQFILQVMNPASGEYLDIRSCVRIGDEFTTPELLDKVNKKPANG